MDIWTEDSNWVVHRMELQWATYNLVNPVETRAVKLMVSVVLDIAIHCFGFAQLAWTYRLKIPIGRPKELSISGPQISAMIHLHFNGQKLHEINSSVYEFMSLGRAYISTTWKPSFLLSTILTTM